MNCHSEDLRTNLQRVEGNLKLLEQDWDRRDEGLREIIADMRELGDKRRANGVVDTELESWAERLEAI